MRPNSNFVPLAMLFSFRQTNESGFFPYLSFCRHYWDFEHDFTRRDWVYIRYHLIQFVSYLKNNNLTSKFHSHTFAVVPSTLSQSMLQVQLFQSENSDFFVLKNKNSSRPIFTITINRKNHNRPHSRNRNGSTNRRCKWTFSLVLLVLSFTKSRHMFTQSRLVKVHFIIAA